MTKNRKNQHSKKQKKKGGAPAGQAAGPPVEDLAGEMENLGLAEPKKAEFEMKSIRAIIYYFETSQREILSQSCTKFAEWDRLVPQRIDILTVTSRVVRINHMVHRFQTRSHFRQLPVVVVDGPADRYGNQLNQKLPRHQNMKDGDILVERPNGDPKKGRHMHGDSNTVPTVQFLERASQNTQINKGVLIRLGRSGRGPPVDLTECLRKFIDDTFGGPRIHLVRQLFVEMDEGIFRFPKELQLRIQRLDLSQGNADGVLKAIEPIIHASSYPIDWLTAQVESPEDPLFRNKTLGAKFAAVDLCIPDLAGASWYNAVGNFVHPHFHLSKTMLSNTDWLTVVQDWILRPRPLGHRFSMTTVNFDALLDLMVFQFRGSRLAVGAFPGGLPSVAVPIPDTELDLVTSHQQFDSWTSQSTIKKLDKIVVEVLERA